jgi:glycosyltransferase involved in cell wall biosynthesis
LTAEPAVGLDLVWLGEAAGGVGRYAEELLRALVEVAPGMRLVGYVSRDAPASLREQAWSQVIEWHELRGPASGQAQLGLRYAALPLLARHHGIEVLHCPSGVGPAVAPGVATAVTVHDLLWLHQAERWEGRRAQRSARILQIHSVRRAARVIAISTATRDDLVATLGADPARIEVVLQGVRPDPEAPRLDEADVRRRHDLGNAPVVLSVAQKRPYKNLAALVRALPALRSEGVRLVLPGSPTDHERELRELARQLGVDDLVRFPGWVSDPELEALYRIASCFVLPSLMEGFGLPVLEAMAREVPVACSDRSSLPEVAGDAALLFDPDDQAAVTGAIVRLLTDDGLVGDLRRRGRERCRLLTWRRTAEGTLAAYRRAAQGRR